MELRRLAYAASLVASVVGIIAIVKDWEHPLTWLAAAVAFIALAGTMER